MEQKNENKILMLKNYCNFLVDFGLNVSFSQPNDMKIKQSKIESKITSIEEIDDYIREWQIKNNFQIMFRNKNIFSKNILLLSETNNFLDFDHSKIKSDLLEKMFFSIGRNIDDFFIINIDLEKVMESHTKKINEILELYFKILNPKIFVNMCSKDLEKFFEINKLNLNFDYFKIPSVSNIMKNQSLKREAWKQLKLLKVKLNEF